MGHLKLELFRELPKACGGILWSRDPRRVRNWFWGGVGFLSIFALIARSE